MVKPSSLSTIIQLVLFGVSCILLATGDEVTLLTTEGATTDLGWRVENRFAPQDFDGWEDLSYLYKNSMVRGYQICNFNQDLKVKPESWLLLPEISIGGASRIYIEMNFTMRVCTDLKETCRETFSVYYQLSNDEDDATDVFDARLFKKIDTVAAETRYEPKEDEDETEDLDSTINNEVVDIFFTNSTQKSTLHIAIVDAGACMVLMGVRIHHKVCRETKAKFAIFKETETGTSDTSLVPVIGTCVPHAMYLDPKSPLDGVMSSSTFDPSSPNLIGPLYHCTSSGDWQVLTGYCRCEPGFQPDRTNTTCLPCPVGKYKPEAGNVKCRSCPIHSSTSSIGASTCSCDEGYNVIREEKGKRNSKECTLCSKLPSSPANLKVSQISQEDPGQIQLSWMKPQDVGGCSMVQYCMICQVSSLATYNYSSKESENCNHLFFRPSRCQITIPRVKVQKLRGHMVYNFTTIAFTLATRQRYSELIKNLTKNDFSMPDLAVGMEDSFYKNLSTLLQISSTSITYTTSDTLPSGVRNPTVTMENQTAIFIKWTEPEFPNGKILYYKVKYALVYEAKSIKEDAGPTLSAPAQYTAAHQYTWEEMLTNNTKALLIDLYPGSKYEIIVFAHNSAGSDNGSIPISATTVSFDDVSNVDPSSNGNFPYLIATVVIAVLVFLICVLLILQWKCRNRKKKENMNEVLEEPTEFRPYNARHDTLEQRTYVDPFSLDSVPPHRFLCEISPESITCDEVIGCGEFGEVFKGNLATIDLKTGQETTIDVAVKRLRDECEPEEQVNFLREAMSLEKFRHPNIVHLEAVVTKNRPFFIVTEYMDHGCLHGFLTKIREIAETQRNGRGWEIPLSHSTMAKMLRGVASGMEYLNGRGYVHRDLAARNVLVNSDLVCKVADFGLMRELEHKDTDSSLGSDVGNGTYTTRGGKIAIRWTAPEAIAFRTYTQFSDIWSFGILMWEAASFGEKPYWDFTNHEVIKAVTDGMRLPAPEKCPSIFHQLMLECWQRDHVKRPTFTQIISRFNHMITNPDVLEVPASPASCGVQEMFFGEDETIPTGDAAESPPVNILKQEGDGESPLQPLLRTVQVDTHKNAESLSNGYHDDDDDDSLICDDEGSEVSSCTSTICASEITVCAGNGVAVYVPLLRSDSESDTRSNTPTHHYYSLTR